jgi:hypothetical protein
MSSKNYLIIFSTQRVFLYTHFLYMLQVFYFVIIFYTLIFYAIIFYTIISHQYAALSKLVLIPGKTNS